ncbi:MAG: ketol-acid reductoisomerase [Coxiellaceae bacterium]|nr:ketol-acid reductoisomerase [Coxiellaceae bacterium]|tara:strand:+ start:373 stop:1374 length:1002 start_codon:yes stop_codon:yes gene_type:complete
MDILFDQSSTVDLILSYRLAIIGYGNQAKAQAKNLRDSGLQVTIGLRHNSESWQSAVDDGFIVKDMISAVENSNFIMMLVPDDVQPTLFDQIKHRIQQGTILAFAHGFCIHYQLIKPTSELSVVLIAPKGPGKSVRSLYLDGKGVPALIAIHQVAKNTKDDPLSVALSYAKAIGSTRAGVFHTTFKDETETDLFGEQAVICGGLTELLKAGFETLIESGYPEEIAFFECLYEVKMIADHVFSNGLAAMHESVSLTAEFGSYISGKRVINSDTKTHMKTILQEIQNGDFTQKMLDDMKHGQSQVLREGRQRLRDHPLEQTAKAVLSKISDVSQN